ncbi:hypothetical protein E0W68_09770 [Flavobacterium salilacus subsp. salilacus]|uniref:hypothetical protein n=1 Tax=Flavobacterium TaxID=237 RepID=UPI001074E38F|nr:MULTISPECIES: hypothetical protein [Flavobacterium]KAF2518300.1 hypothetical protein E0W68_09770 [Flavobacterium salilacus subsp. salilacus]MBE1615286.1 hypothetical protein [Flavobacterium sp. SaA2.13]
MKKLLFLFLLFSIQVYSQSDETVVYGRIESKYDEIKLKSVIAMRIRYYTQDNSYYTFADVEKDGNYSRKLPHNVRVLIAPNYHNYHADTIEVYTGLKDSIRVDFILKPKKYIYTQTKAIQDIEKGLVQLITFDTLEYEWSRKVDLKKKLGFDYLLLKEPKDDDFYDEMAIYNQQTEAFLSEQKPDWEYNLSILRDSIIHLEADQYGENHIINIKKLKVPAKEKLPEEMKKRIEARYNEYVNVKDNSVYKPLDKKHMLKIILTEKDYNKMSLVLDKLSEEYDVMIPELIQLLTDKKEIGIENFQGIIVDRQNGPLTFHCCIPIPFSRDDLYTVAGRANYLLKIITTEDHGNIYPDTNEEYLKKIQNRWAYWLLQLQE